MWFGRSHCHDTLENNRNPKRTLLVIDVQNEYFTGKLPITYPADSLTNVLNAMDGAGAQGVRVAAIQLGSPLRPHFAVRPSKANKEPVPQPMPAMISDA